MADLDLRCERRAERDDLIDNIVRTIKLEGKHGANLYIISYRDPDPQQARKVVQSLLAIFVESSLGDKRQDTQTAVKFLDDQIKRYEETCEPPRTASRISAQVHRRRRTATQDYFSRMSRLASDIETRQAGAAGGRASRELPTRRELAGEPPNLVPEIAERRGARFDTGDRRAHCRAEARSRHAAAQVHRCSTRTSSRRSG